MKKNDGLQQELKRRSKPSGPDSQLHGGMMEASDQFGNLVAGAMGNLTGIDEDPPTKKQSK